MALGTERRRGKEAHLLAIEAEASLVLVCTERKNGLFHWPYS